MTEWQARSSGRRMLRRITVLKRNCKVRVWENMGWHYSVVHPSMSIMQSGPNQYWALPNPSYVDWCEHPHKHHSNPDAAILAALKFMRYEVTHRVGILRALERDMK